MLGWVGDIERATLENETFRTVLHTGGHLQLTVMRLGPGTSAARRIHTSISFFASNRGPAASSSAGPKTP
jgi:hypothetical protein